MPGQVVKSAIWGLDAGKIGREPAEKQIAGLLRTAIISGQLPITRSFIVSNRVVTGRMPESKSSRPYATSAIVTSAVFVFIGGGISAFAASIGSGLLAFLAVIGTWALVVYVIFDKVDEMVIDRIKEYDRFAQMEDAGVGGEARQPS